ncbi:hypothetical protein ABEB36_014319 [Hypothenemus hampei]|uniref:Uncharacterized protein n=1 Tax=Hypothenemus hampei TaxID=57062 RepID=A0ABD1E418_HYPHA
MLSKKRPKKLSSRDVEINSDDLPPSSNIKIKSESTDNIKEKINKVLKQSFENIILLHYQEVIQFKQQSEKIAPQQQRQVSFFSQFTTNIQYNRGIENKTVTDYLFQPFVDAINTTTKLTLKPLKCRRLNPQ